MEAKTRETLASLRVTTIKSIRQTVATLSGGQRQSVAVARAVMWNSRLVILDEPTAALGVAQTEQVLALVNRLAEQGLGVDPDLAQPPRHLRDRARGSPCSVSAATPASSSAPRRHAGGGRARDHRRPADEGLGHSRHGRGDRMTRGRRRRPRPRRTSSSRCRRGSGRTSAPGNLGSWPVLIALALVVLVFSQTAQNFFSPANFTNIITQMAGTCLIAYGVVFVLLIGEIDLSVAFVSGVAGVVVAKAQLPTGANLPWYVCVFLAILAATRDRRLPGLDRRADRRAVVRRHACRLRDLAGRDPAHGHAGRDHDPGPARSTTSRTTSSSTTAGWIMAARRQRRLRRRDARRRVRRPAARDRVRDPVVLALKVVVVPAIAFVTVWILNKDRRRAARPAADGRRAARLDVRRQADDFGRHVYAVGGNAEAARRAGINVARIRILVFMIAGGMSGLGGIVLAARLNSVDLNAGGGTLLIDAIAAAVIGGTSLFGGRGEIRNALIGAALISTVSNGMFILGYSTGIIFIVTGAILLLAVTFDTVVRRLQMRSGR